MAEAKKKQAEVKEAELVVEATPVKEEKPIAKAGKRSAKAIREEEAETAKQTRKAAPHEEAPKVAKKPTRSKVERSGKKYREAAKLVDKEKLYSLSEALNLATKTATTKFDSTVEMHINLSVDPRQADQNVRDTVILPAGTGKTIRVAVLADADDAKAALAAGADIAGLEDITAKLDKEQLEFDVLISTPSQMPKLGKYARLLGPRGLMPNPKSGTVTTEVAKAVKEAKAGKVEYRVDQTGIVHIGIGKVSFGAQKLQQNADAIITSVKNAKPSSSKGSYIKSAYLTTSMGPSIKFELA
jgi:large subunit ribosomal protein L1